MPCQPDFLKMSHHRLNTKYGDNTSFIHQDIVFRPKTEFMLLYIDTFNSLTLNNFQKHVFCLFFKNVPPSRTVMVGNTWNLKKDSKKFRRTYKLNKNINYMLYLPNWPFFGVKKVLLVLLARWWDILKYKNAI